MTNKKRFNVLGVPQGKGRPRFMKNGHTYTPERTSAYENEVRTAYKMQCDSTLLEGAIHAQITAYFPIPKSTTKAWMDVLKTEKARHIKRPDADNVAKIICDALNEIAFKDDSNIADLVVRKRYSALPRVEVILTEVHGISET